MPDPLTLAQLITARAGTVSEFLAYDRPPASKPAKAYVVHYFGGGAPMSSSMTGHQSGLRWQYRAVCVGFTQDQCMWLVGRYRARFLNWRPTGNRADGWLTEAPDNAPMLPATSIEGDTRYSITLRFILHAGA